jgi:hypothetical protein
MKVKCLYYGLLLAGAYAASGLEKRKHLRAEVEEVRYDLLLFPPPTERP